jgi:hypothetical protein
MDPATPPGIELERLAQELDELDTKLAAERTRVAGDKRRLADQLHNANRLVTVEF